MKYLFLLFIFTFASSAFASNNYADNRALIAQNAENNENSILNSELNSDHSEESSELTTVNLQTFSFQIPMNLNFEVLSNGSVSVSDPKNPEHELFIYIQKSDMNLEELLADLKQIFSADPIYQDGLYRYEYISMNSKFYYVVVDEKPVFGFCVLTALNQNFMNVIKSIKVNL